ncbi:hypothetical protein C9J48_04870 [Photobacterium profundum]|nr:hypothetical protein [Photobacterium profundum]PSV62848.1 hypothetical protein C9J48_04870 [Photobacterium profundum]
MMLKHTVNLLFCCYLLMLSIPSYSHHVLGRPSYSLNEDSNTPPSMAVETQIGNYFITYMVFPAFPKPNEPGRVNLYATRIDNGQTLNTSITFSVRDDRWFGSKEPNETIGLQEIDDGVYRQGFLFKKAGDYVIRAHFEADGEPYEIDFPLQVGSGNSVGPIGAAIGFLIFFLICINIVQRKRIARSKIQQGKQTS